MKLPRAFGPYTLLKRLAVGGMAEVYVAKTHGLGGFEKQVALKLVHPHLSVDEHFVRMLVDEAKVLVKLNHANIAQVLDLGRIGDDYYISMEYVDGWNLHQIVSASRALGKRVAPEMAAHIVAETCAGLDHAHRKRDDDGRPLNLVHRDVSPQNILVSQSGEVKLVDFGIAKGSHRRGEGTEVGVIKGKYNYMSPEQAWADPMDRRSDIFSAGVVLWEALAGRMLHQEANVPKLIANVRNATVPPVSAERGDAPPALEAIVARATAKEPDERFPSAADMAEALRDFVYQHAPAYNARKLSAEVGALMAEHAQAIAEGRIADKRRTVVSTREQLPPENLGAVSVVTRDEWPDQLPKPPARPRPRSESRLPPLPFDSIAPSTERMSQPPQARSVPPPVPSVPPPVPSRPPAPPAPPAWPAASSHTDPAPPPDPWGQGEGQERTRVDVHRGGLPPNPAPPASPLDPQFDEETTARYRPSQMAPAAVAPPPSFPPAPANETAGTTRRNSFSREAWRPPASGVESIPSVPPIPALPDVHEGSPFRGPRGRRGLLTGATVAAVMLVLGVLAWKLLGPAPAPAQLEILSEPSGATVFVDDTRRTQMTPARLSGFEPNRDYELRVEKPGFVPWKGTYHAAHGLVQHIAVLKPQKAELYISTVPTGATLRIDGVKIGVAPLRVSALELGRRITVEATLPGHRTATQSYTIVREQLRPRMELRLQKQKGR